MALLVWSRTDDGAAERFVARAPVLLAAGGGRLAPLQEADSAAGVVLAAARVAPDVVAAVFVPDAPRNPVVRRDGLPLRAGMHLLRHGAELTVGGRTYWVAGDRAAEQTTYDPVIHGEDLACHLTRASLTAGESIVVCPGGAGGVCGALYRASAWRTALSGPSGLACPACGCRPDPDEWSPPPSQGTGRLQELLRFAAGQEPLHV